MIIKELDTGETATGYQAYAAWADAEDRSNKAREAHPNFFNNAHDDLVAQVRAIADSFFKVKKAIYVTARGGTIKTGPFTVVKVHNPTWVNGMFAARNVEFYDKLAALGIAEVKNSTQGTSIIVK